MKIGLHCLLLGSDWLGILWIDNSMKLLKQLYEKLIYFHFYPLTLPALWTAIAVLEQLLRDRLCLESSAYCKMECHRTFHHSPRGLDGI